MTDRELLELAAKAAGIEWYGMAGDDNDSCAYFDIGPDEVVKWNPLRDDGDALRLAVRLGLNVCADIVIGAVGVIDPMNNKTAMTLGADPCATTRRAIVIAAAEIGRRLAGLPDAIRELKEQR
jgi:hypothetical protein